MEGVLQEMFDLTKTSLGQKWQIRSVQIEKERVNVRYVGQNEEELSLALTYPGTKRVQSGFPFAWRVMSGDMDGPTRNALVQRMKATAAKFRWIEAGSEEARSAGRSKDSGAKSKGATSQKRARVEALIQQAWSGDREKALSELGALIEAGNLGDELLFRVATLHSEQGRTEQSRSLCHKILAGGDGNADGAKSLSMVHRKSIRAACRLVGGDETEGLQLLRSIQEQEGASAKERCQTAHYLGIWRAIPRVDSLLAWLERLDKSDPSCARALSLWLSILASKSPSDAIEKGERWAQENRATKELHMQLGRLLARQKAFARALVHFSSACKDMKCDDLVRKQVIRCVSELLEDDAARATLQKNAAKKGAHPIDFLALGVLEHHRYYFEDAVFALGKAYEAWPNDPLVGAYLAINLHRLAGNQMDERAVKIMNQARSAKGDLDAMVYFIDAVIFRNRAPKRAKESAERYLEKSGDRPAGPRDEKAKTLLNELTLAQAEIENGKSPKPIADPDNLGVSKDGPKKPRKADTATQNRVASGEASASTAANTQKAPHKVAVTPKAQSKPPNEEAGIKNVVIPIIFGVLAAIGFLVLRRRYRAS